MWKLLIVSSTNSDSWKPFSAQTSYWPHWLPRFLSDQDLGIFCFMKGKSEATNRMDWSGKKTLERNNAGSTLHISVLCYFCRILII